MSLGNLHFVAFLIPVIENRFILQLCNIYSCWKVGCESDRDNDSPSWLKWFLQYFYVRWNILLSGWFNIYKIKSISGWVEFCRFISWQFENRFVWQTIWALKILFVLFFERRYAKKNHWSSRHGNEMHEKSKWKCTITHCSSARRAVSFFVKWNVVRISSYYKFIVTDLVNQLRCFLHLFSKYKRHMWIRAALRKSSISWLWIVRPNHFRSCIIWLAMIFHLKFTSAYVISIVCAESEFYARMLFTRQIRIGLISQSIVAFLLHVFECTHTIRFAHSSNEKSNDIIFIAIDGKRNGKIFRLPPFFTHTHHFDIANQVFLVPSVAQRRSIRRCNPLTRYSEISLLKILRAMLFSLTYRHTESKTRN